MTRKLISTKIPEEDLTIIDEAAKLDKRNRSQFFHVAAYERAVEILQQCEVKQNETRN